jgi:predicted Zn finger-like uncharacterized protein
MNVACPSCQTVFRVDPERVPQPGVRVRCDRCPAIFLLTRSGAQAVRQEARQPAAPAAPVAPAASAPGAGAGASRPAFGAADPGVRAQRLARALVSDMLAYHPERRERGLREGTLRSEFREEIMKSWEEYVDQVGDALARGTPYFRNALNEILAGGRKTF